MYKLETGIRTENEVVRTYETSESIELLESIALSIDLEGNNTMEYCFITQEKSGDSQINLNDEIDSSLISENEVVILNLIERF